MYIISTAFCILFRTTSRDVLPGTLSRPVVGPALKIREQLFKWEGVPTHDSQTGQTGSKPVDFRVAFESGVEEEVTSCLLMANCGTTVIYYSWKVYTCDINKTSLN